MLDPGRRQFLTLLGGAAAWPLAARGQQPDRVWRIGVLETTSMELNAANFEAFRQSLRALGYIEEQNLIIEYRSAEGRGERFADLAADLLRSLLGGAATAWPLAVSAQQSERMRRIGVLMPYAEDNPVGQARLAAFLEGLRQLGWADGRNVRIDSRWGAGDASLTRTYARELVARGPDVVMAVSSGASGAVAGGDTQRSDRVRGGR